MENEKKRGRKRKNLNDKKVEELIQNGLSIRDIAKIMNVDEKTIRGNYSAKLEKRKNDEIIEMNSKKKRLIDKQFDVAMEGNPIMLIWLGKNWLGQNDKIKVNGKNRLIVEQRRIKS